MSPLGDAALLALHAGLCPVPPRQDGSKAPSGYWKQFQSTRPDEATVADWYRQDLTGLGLVCGTVSGGLEMLELEGRAIDEGLGDAFDDAAAAAGLGELVARIQAGYSETTPSGGVHLLYRCSEVSGNLKLARRPATAEELAENPGDRIKVLIETRGQGGYVIVAPSSGRVHPTGRPWQLHAGSFDTIVTITPEERRALLDLTRMFDRMPHEDIAVATLPPRTEGAGGRPGDEWAARTTWEEILEPHGWVRVYATGEAMAWRRPGKTVGVSATTNHGGSDLLFVFSSSTTFEPERSYTKLGAYAVLNHGGDFGAAARALHHDGYGRAPAPAVPTLRVVEDGDPGPEWQDQGEQGDDGRFPDLTSWEPINLRPILDDIVSGTVTRPIPTLLVRTDGVGLWYPGCTNGLFGESGCGKSWVALYGCSQQILAGRHVVWIDFEDQAINVVLRLLDLGTPIAVIEQHFHYLSPETGFSPVNALPLLDLMDAVSPTLAIIDSTGEAMAVQGTKDKDDEVAAWFRIFPRRLARTGCCVGVIDHVVKDIESRGLYAIGSQRKRAAIDGAVFAVEAVKEFGRGMAGTARLMCAKDRHGSHVKGRISGLFHLDASTAVLTAEMAVPHGMTSVFFRPTILMEKISSALEEAGTGGLSKTSIEATVRGDNNAKRLALDLLIADGYVLQSKSGTALRHTLSHPYKVVDDPKATP